jgi:glutathione gamma-glutamylcysteinyltransferase
VSEETLFCDTEKLCVHSASKIRTEGMDFQDFEALGRCHGVQIQPFRLPSVNIDTFRELIIRTCRSAEKQSFVICNFSRKALQQTGDGHFSPIGGYHETTDSVLILDVARFKYPPYWVPVEALWASMQSVDGKTGLPRGYFVVAADPNKNKAHTPCRDHSHEK